MRYLALLLIGWLSLPVHALTKVDIYRAEVVIDGEQENGESLALQQGMQDVIIRATGSQSSLSHPIIQKALSSNSRYISQLSYGKINGQSSLKMRFNAGQISSLLTQAQLPTWAPYRSNILVWVIEEQHYDRTIAWEYSDSQNISILRDAADARGLPITLPVGDFDDVTGVNVSDIWGGFVEPIAKASQRYPVEAVLVLRVQSDQVRWTLYDQSPSTILDSPDAPRSGSASGVDAMSATIHAITDYYSSKSAVVVTGEASDGITMKVMNVNSASDFFRLERTLKKLRSVAGSEVKRIQGNELTLTLRLLASKEAFKREASAIKQLTEYHDSMQQLEEMFVEPSAQATAQVEVLTEEDKSGAAVMTADMLSEGVQTPEPVIIQPVQEQYDLIYEWTPGQRS